MSHDLNFASNKRKKSISNIKITTIESVKNPLKNYKLTVSNNNMLDSEFSNSYADILENFKANKRNLLNINCNFVSMIPKPPKDYYHKLSKYCDFYSDIPNKN